MNNPRRLMKAPYRDSTTAAAQAIATGQPRADTAVVRAPGLTSGNPPVPAQPGAPSPVGVPRGQPPVVTDTSALAPRVLANRDSVSRDRSIYRSATGNRASSDLPSAPERAETVVSVAQLLDSAAIALPDTTRFKSYGYRIGFQPEYISRPSIGYAQDNFGRGVFGGTTIVLSDLLGDHRLAFAAQINGRLSEAYLLASYTTMAKRTQYTTGMLQAPRFYLNGQIDGVDDKGRYLITQQISRYITRQAFWIGAYPLNRFTRLEFGASFNNVDRSSQLYTEYYRVSDGAYLGYENGLFIHQRGMTYGAPFAAYVSDNTLFGYTGPISGRRYRFQIEPTMGSYQWTEYQADYRRYFPILFNFLTLAVRGQSSISVGRDERVLQKHIGRPEFVRGYDREEYGVSCVTVPPGGVRPPSQSGCSAVDLLGSRVMFGNAELRFPLVRRFDLGLLPISLPPVDGLVFYDIGIAWSHGQNIKWSADPNDNVRLTRSPRRSYGAGIRMNLFGFALLRWDYSIPLDRPTTSYKGYWTWALGPSF